MKKRFLWGLALTCAATLGHAADQVVHVYNWSDYIAEDTLNKFTEATGIKVVYDVYDGNEVLEAKLLAGKSGYDVVFPSAQPFAQRHIAAGIYQKLDRGALKNYGNLDQDILKTLAAADPSNAHLVPYMWGTTGIGFNVKKVREALGENAPTDSWRLLFDPANAKKLQGCGISVLDDEQEAFSAALIYLGKDPNSTNEADFAAAEDALRAIRPYVRYFHSSQYINDLANADLCVAMGYSGDVLQARDRAAEAENDVEVEYRIPVEGAVMWIDTMAIPADAPHAAAAHRFIDFLMEPEVIADITHFVAYANANSASAGLLDGSITEDPAIYPSPKVKARLVMPKVLDPSVQRLRTRAWTRLKSGQ